MENDKEKDKKDNGKKEESGFDFLGLGGLMKGVEKLIDLAGKLDETGSVKKEGEINLDNLKKGMKGVYGFTINTVVGGGPKVETFGNIKKTPKGPRVGEEREPITDVFDEKNELVIIAEMPGIEEKDITIELKEDILTISAKGQSRQYSKELLLPVKVKDTTFSKKYNNGILEIRLKK